MRITLSFLLFCCPVALAHEAVPEDTCVPPSISINFYDDNELEAFLVEFKTFQSCISAFAEEHHQKAMEHNAAASASLNKLFILMRDIAEAVPEELRDEVGKRVSE